MSMVFSCWVYFNVPVPQIESEIFLSQNFSKMNIIFVYDNFHDMYHVISDVKVLSSKQFLSKNNLSSVSRKSRHLK